MAIFNSNLFQKLKGKIDNFVFYEAKGRQCIRKYNTKPLPPPNCSQNLQKCRMRATVALYRANRTTRIPYIWKLNAVNRTMTGYNLFISTNMPAFDQEHTICDYSMLHFSCGKLEWPPQLQVAEYGNGNINIRWQNLSKKCSPRMHDRLYAMWLKDDGNFCLQTIPQSFATRADGQAVLTVAEAGKENMHLYLYFANQTEDCFSPDKYFFLESKK